MHVCGRTAGGVSVSDLHPFKVSTPLLLSLAMRWAGVVWTISTVSLQLMLWGDLLSCLNNNKSTINENISVDMPHVTHFWQASRRVTRMGIFTFPLRVACKRNGM